jgi:hypothetical protein
MNISDAIDRSRLSGMVESAAYVGNAEELLAEIAALHAGEIEALATDGDWVDILGYDADTQKGQMAWHLDVTLVSDA